MKTYTLFLNSASDYTINDQNGHAVSLARAQKLWIAGRVNGSNQSFSRLANEFDFDLGRLKKYYLELGVCGVCQWPRDLVRTREGQK
jgi:hypothetical protein